ncbi:uncharacterized protein LOC115631618 isoform X2 [Scaptodrosophila lebanonensis]|uniref:Uncharacterized protein LOC115631618 isoform X2 n=1 Tax=Drosophila lebanonensis TaxID=7225 RepID=A0A6J2U7J1_DROLE|nr:uncharacterized protein LOC115631618 isoform X2 [Scaptodrosophila lebanonensis]
MPAYCRVKRTGKLSLLRRALNRTGRRSSLISEIYRHDHNSAKTGETSNDLNVLPSFSGDSTSIYHVVGVLSETSTTTNEFVKELDSVHSLTISKSSHSKDLNIPVTKRISGSLQKGMDGTSYKADHPVKGMAKCKKRMADKERKQANSSTMKTSSKSVQTDVKYDSSRTRKKSGMAIEQFSNLKCKSSSRFQNVALVEGAIYPSTWNINASTEKIKNYPILCSLTEVINCKRLNRTPYDHKLEMPPSPRRPRMAGDYCGCNHCGCQFIKHVDESRDLKHFSGSPKKAKIQKKALVVPPLPKDKGPEKSSTQKWRRKATPSGVSLSRSMATYSMGGQDASRCDNQKSCPCRIKILPMMDEINANCCDFSDHSSGSVQEASNIQLKCRNLQIICCNCQGATKGQFPTNLDESGPTQITEDVKIGQNCGIKNIDLASKKTSVAPTPRNNDLEHFLRIESISQPPSVKTRKNSLERIYSEIIISTTQLPPEPLSFPARISKRSSERNISQMMSRNASQKLLSQRISRKPSCNDIGKLQDESSEISIISVSDFKCVPLKKSDLKSMDCCSDDENYEYKRCVLIVKRRRKSKQRSSKCDDDRTQCPSRFSSQHNMPEVRTPKYERKKKQLESRPNSFMNSYQSLNHIPSRHVKIKPKVSRIGLNKPSGGKSRNCRQQDRERSSVSQGFNRKAKSDRSCSQKRASSCRTSTNRATDYNDYSKTHYPSCCRKMPSTKSVKPESKFTWNNINNNTCAETKEPKRKNNCTCCCSRKKRAEKSCQNDFDDDIPPRSRSSSQHDINTRISTQSLNTCSDQETPGTRLCSRKSSLHDLHREKTPRSRMSYQDITISVSNSLTNNDPLNEISRDISHQEIQGSESPPAAKKCEPPCVDIPVYVCNDCKCRDGDSKRSAKCIQVRAEQIEKCCQVQTENDQNWLPSCYNYQTEMPAPTCYCCNHQPAYMMPTQPIWYWSSVHQPIVRQCCKSNITCFSRSPRTVTMAMNGTEPQTNFYDQIAPSCKSCSLSKPPNENNLLCSFENEPERKCSGSSKGCPGCRVDYYGGSVVVPLQNLRHSLAENPACTSKCCIYDPIYKEKKSASENAAISGGSEFSLTYTSKFEKQCRINPQYAPTTLTSYEKNILKGLEDQKTGAFIKLTDSRDSLVVSHERLNRHDSFTTIDSGQSTRKYCKDCRNRPQVPDSFKHNPLSEMSEPEPCNAACSRKKKQSRGLCNRRPRGDRVEEHESENQPKEPRERKGLCKRNRPKNERVDEYESDPQTGEKRERRGFCKRDGTKRDRQPKEKPLKKENSSTSSFFSKKRKQPKEPKEKSSSTSLFKKKEKKIREPKEKTSSSSWFNRKEKKRKEPKEKKPKKSKEPKEKSSSTRSFFSRKQKEPKQPKANSSSTRSFFSRKQKEPKQPKEKSSSTRSLFNRKQKEAKPQKEPKAPKEPKQRSSNRGFFNCNRDRDKQPKQSQNSRQVKEPKSPKEQKPPKEPKQSKETEPGKPKKQWNLCQRRQEKKQNDREVVRQSCKEPAPTKQETDQWQRNQSRGHPPPEEEPHHWQQNTESRGLPPPEEEPNHSQPRTETPKQTNDDDVKVLFESSYNFSKDSTQILVDDEDMITPTTNRRTRGETQPPQPSENNFYAICSCQEGPAPGPYCHQQTCSQKRKKSIFRV